jgi:pimeloyl-ACP methyl ester carboxylesterase
MKLLLRVLAWFALLPYVVLAGLVLTGIASWSAVLYVVATGVLLGGLATLPPDPIDGDAETKRRRPRGVSRIGLALIVAVALVRCFTGAHGKKLALGQSNGESARVVDRVVDESDVALTGARLLFAAGMLHDDDKEVPTAMRSAYERMRAEEGDLPTPFVGTYLGLERPGDFDVALIEPRGASSPGPSADARKAVIFLHGFGGNFDLPCWQIAKTVGPLGVTTACPSTRWLGDWSSEEGEATLRRTVELLHARGVDGIVLVGLSAGGYGASLLAPKMKGSFAGLVLVSGATPSAPSAGVPSLVIHGTRDTMASYEDGSLYAADHGSKLVSLDAGHFAMLVRPEAFDRELGAFVAARLGTKTVAAR